MRLLTDSFDPNGFVDPRYTCDVDNSSPELRWDEIPEGTAGFAAVVEDPDAKSPSGEPFAHWVVYGIPLEIHHLPAGIPPQDTLPNGIRQGLNGFGKLGYSGPCPPHGSKSHRYIFRVYALRAMPEIPSRAPREQLLSIIAPFVISTGEIMGKYARVIQRAG